ncbi:MAG TPA: hypothetical protein VFO67_21810 [Gemmatimonadales bacterium]|nr:hypothetical protein [Gemmatimonadales bacterium]
MTREQVLTWLDTRRPAPPAGLRGRLHRAVDDLLPTPGSQLPSYLALLGRRLLDRVVSQPNGGRELALDLLAADAFATYAFEAQAEEGKEAVE